MLDNFINFKVYGTIAPNTVLLQNACSHIISNILINIHTSLFNRFSGITPNVKFLNGKCWQLIWKLHNNTFF